MEKSNGLVKQKYLRNRIRIKRIGAMFIMGAAVLFFAGCSDGGSGGGMDGEGSANPASVMEGVFVDSPVQGLDYMTPTHTGITDEEGRFTCLEGEMITFMIGDVTLGQAKVKEIMTSLDFLDESETPFDLTHPMVTNMGRFLQSLDADGDPENGITLSEEVRAEINGRMIDFYQSVEDFENDPDVEACFDVFNALDMPHNGMPWELFPTDQVRRHMNEHMGQYMGEHMGFDLPEGPDDEFDHPMDEYMDDERLEFMNDHMGYGDSETDKTGYPMGQYRGNHM